MGLVCPVAESEVVYTSEYVFLAVRRRYRPYETNKCMVKTCLG